jgi:holo-ACP synthase CitX
MRSSPSSSTGTVRSSTSSVASGSELLAARDGRHASLQLALLKSGPALLCLSLNMPGAAKFPPGARALFLWGREEILRGLPGARELSLGVDALGPFALLTTEAEPATAKGWGVRLEGSEPAARLLDLDVYDRRGLPLDRAALGLPQRSCLLCPEPARECIRLGRHPLEAVLERVDELLAPFRD